MIWPESIIAKFAVVTSILIPAILGTLMMCRIAGRRRCRRCSMRIAAEEYEEFVKQNDVEE